MLALNLISIALLSFVVFQDFKERKIYAWLPIALFIIFFLKSFLVVGFDLTARFVLINASIIFAQISFLFTYFIIKNKKVINIIDTQIGIGDILFFLAICPLFSVYNFLFFFITSLLLTILIYTIKKGSIPLAGILASFLILIISTTIFGHSLEFTGDDTLLNTFNLISL